MYERPKLNPVGNASEVVLGYVVNGSDLDTTFIDSAFEFAPDVCFEE